MPQNRTCTCTILPSTAKMVVPIIIPLQGISLSSYLTRCHQSLTLFSTSYFNQHNGYNIEGLLIYPIPGLLRSLKIFSVIDFLGFCSYKPFVHIHHFSLNHSNYLYILIFVNYTCYIVSVSKWLLTAFFYTLVFPFNVLKFIILILHNVMNICDFIKILSHAVIFYKSQANILLYHFLVV